MQLPSTEKVHYKFVVDGHWTIDQKASSEEDSSANINNVLKPEDIMSSESNFGNPASAFITSQGPSSSTTQMAGQVPLEKDKVGSDHVPGAFPAETPQTERKENPMPGSEGMLIDRARVTSTAMHHRVQSRAVTSVV